MNEQRLQAYLQLIQALLNCPPGEEAQILNANSNLVDAGLVEVMLKTAEVLKERNNRKVANFLLNLAHQLFEELGLQLSAPTCFLLPNPDPQFDFLLEVLQATQESNHNPQVVYPILKANLDNLNDKLAKFLHDWARTTLLAVEPDLAQRIAGDISNFSFLIQDFQLGSRANNLEIAITGYKVAATVFTHKAFPKEWVEIQNNLGEAYRHRIYGDKLQNLEDALIVIKNALIYTLQAFLDTRAMLQNKLGLVYQDQGQTALAISAHKDALQVYSHQGLSKEWADTQNYLGIAYSNQRNIDEAIAAYKNALKVYTPGTEKWAEIKNNLAISYTKQGRIEQAISICQELLQVYTREVFPEGWARIQYNLGHAYRNLGNIQEAMKCFRLALGIFTPTAFPINCFYTAGSLSKIAFTQRCWAEAIKKYDIAIEAVEQSREWASSDNRKAEILSAAINLYAEMVPACINNGQLNKALETVERSKARNLVELLATRDHYPKGDIPETVLNELNRLRREITAEQRSLEIQQRNRSQQLGDVQTPTRDRTHLNQLQQQLDKLIARDIAPIDPDFRLTQKVEPIPYSDIQGLTCENTSILEWYILGDKFLTFIITPQSQTPIVWQSTLEDFQDLINWSSEYLKAYLTDKTQWRENLTSHLQRLAEILHFDDILSQIPQECDHLILIPHRFLHLFPLHALPLPDVGAKHSGRGSRGETTNPDPNASPFPGTQPKQTSSNLPISFEGEAFAVKNFGEKTEVLDANASPLQGLCLLDRFPGGVGYAPSCQLLQQAQNRQRPDFTHLFAIQNPTFDLTYTDLEVQTIQQHFHSRDVLVKSDAKKSGINPQRLSNAHCVHFSGHGYFNFNQPLLSALLLADSQQDEKILDLTNCLTLDDLFSLDLSQCRLVVLSACETGLTDLTSISDEYIGLPSGFLVAGSPSVVSSLWTVSDLSTALLTIKFYENLQSCCKDKSDRISLALNQAQKWLRTRTSEDCEKFLDRLQPQIEQILAQLPQGKRFVFEDAIEESRKEIRDRQPYPFANPFYWAAFTATGL